MDILSSLQLVELNRIDLHERHEPARLKGTCNALREEGVLRHPLLAVWTEEGRCLLLDGAHRMCSLKRLGCKRAPVQMVRPGEFALESWDHMVPSGSWFTRLPRDDALLLTEEPEPDLLLARLVDDRGDVRYVHARPGSRPEERLQAWHRLVDAYNGAGPVRRFPGGTRNRPDSGCLLLQYPRCTLQEIKQTVKRGDTLPAGVTRFVVRGRLLNLRVPLSLLSEETVDAREWENHLRQWSGKLRLYTESVYLCEA